MHHPSTPPRPVTPRLYWWATAISVALALVPTVWTAVDLEAASIFTSQPARLQAVHWWWVEWINLYLPTAFRYFLAGAAVLWVALRWRGAASTPWRFALAFVVLAGILGPGAVVNWGFKENWQRARPYQVEPFGGTAQFTRAAVVTDQCDNNCSFVSGHTACGFFFASLMLVHQRRRWQWLATGLSAGWLTGFARIADSAHWLSDVLWACPITMLTSWCVWRMLVHLSSVKKLPI